VTSSRCSSHPSTQLPWKEPLQLQQPLQLLQPLQLPPKQSPTIAHLLCCGAKHLYVDGSSTATEPKESSQQRIQQRIQQQIK
jgi:hypothetical protein